MTSMISFDDLFNGMKKASDEKANSIFCVELLEKFRLDAADSEDEYSRGVYNVCELVMAVHEGRDPIYKEKE
jgi:hypothetical protein